MENLAVPGESGLTTNANTMLKLIDETLGENESFVIIHTGKYLLGSTSIMNQARRALFTVKLIPPVTITNRDGQPETIIRMTNTSGKILLTAKDSAWGATIWSGGDGQYLGKLVKVNGSIAVVSATGEPLFHLDRHVEKCCGSLPSELHLIRNGVTVTTVASIKKTSESADAEMYFSESSSLDVLTKALLIFTGYFLYLDYFAETSVGRTGRDGIRRTSINATYSVCFLIFFAMVFVFLIITLSITK